MAALQRVLTVAAGVGAAAMCPKPKFVMEEEGRNGTEAATSPLLWALSRGALPYGLPTQRHQYS